MGFGVLFCGYLITYLLSLNPYAALTRLIDSMEDSDWETTALRNICHRLQLREAEGLGFALMRSPLGGLCVRMTLRDEVNENEITDR